MVAWVCERCLADLHLTSSMFDGPFGCTLLRWASLMTTPSPYSVVAGRVNAVHAVACKTDAR